MEDFEEDSWNVGPIFEDPVRELWQVSATFEHIRGEKAVTILKSEDVSTQFKLVDTAELTSLLSPQFIRDSEKEGIERLALVDKKTAAEKLLDIIMGHFEEGRIDANLNDLIETLKKREQYEILIATIKTVSELYGFQQTVLENKDVDCSLEPPEETFEHTASSSTESTKETVPRTLPPHLKKKIMEPIEDLCVVLSPFERRAVISDLEKASMSMYEEYTEFRTETQKTEKSTNQLFNEPKKVEASKTEVHQMTYILEVELKKTQRITQPQLKQIVLKDPNSTKVFPDFKETLIHSFSHNCLVAYVEAANEEFSLKDTIADHWAYDKFPQFDFIVFVDITTINGSSIRELAFNAIKELQPKLFDRLEKYLTEEKLFFITGRPRNIEKEEESPFAHVLLIVHNFTEEAVKHCDVIRSLLLAGEKPLLPLSLLLITDESGLKLIKSVVKRGFVR